MTTRVIGSMVLSAIIIAMPILFVLAFIYDWDILIKIVLLGITLCEYIVLCGWVYEEDKENG